MLFRCLPQQAQVVEHPVAPTLGRRRQVPVTDGEVGDRDDRQVQLQPPPVRAVVGRVPHASLRAGIKQARPFRIGPDHAGELVFRNAADDGFPAPAVVGGLEQVRLEIVQLVSRGGQVQPARFEGVRLDRVDLGVARQAAWRHVGPCGPAVTGQVQQAVVGAGPDHARFLP